MENNANMPDNKTASLQQWLWIVVAVIVLDQATKLLADNLLTYQHPLQIMPLFNLTLVYNQGAAFSFLSNAGGWQRWFFVILSAVISIALVIWLRKIEARHKY